jgi:hypothetical protein
MHDSIYGDSLNKGSTKKDDDNNTYIIIGLLICCIYCICSSSLLSSSLAYMYKEQSDKTTTHSPVQTTTHSPVQTTTVTPVQTTTHSPIQTTTVTPVQTTTSVPTSTSAAIADVPSIKITDNANFKTMFKKNYLDTHELNYLNTTFYSTMYKPVNIKDITEPQKYIILHTVQNKKTKFESYLLYVNNFNDTVNSDGFVPVEHITDLPEKELLNGPIEWFNITNRTSISFDIVQTDYSSLNIALQYT